MKKKIEKKYALVVFDMDGTILNTLEDLWNSLNHTLSQNGYPERTLEETRTFVGNGIRKLIERALPAGTANEEVDRMYGKFIPYYQLHCADKTRPYAGVTELLRTLRGAGFLTAVVSNKADSAVQELCTQYFEGLFDYAIGEKPGMRKKPAPDAVDEVLERLGVQREKAVYIGDSEVDIATAKNAGLDSIIVKWGFREEDFLKEHGAEVLAATPKEVEEILLQE